VTLIDRGYRRRKVGLSAQDHAHRVGPLLTHSGKKLRTVHARHSHVGNDQRERTGIAQKA
jgi:hypothetical protein